MSLRAEDHCEECGTELFSDCWGRLRCEECDGPCPGCFDGGGPGWGETDDEEDETDEYEDGDDNDE